MDDFSGAEIGVEEMREADLDLVGVEVDIALVLSQTASKPFAAAALPLAFVAVGLDELDADIQYQHNRTSERIN